MAESFRPVRFWYSAIRSLYALAARKSRMSTGSMSASASSNESGSSRWPNRSRTPMAKWCSHFGQTRWFAASSSLWMTSPHSGHGMKRPPGIWSFLFSPPPEMKLGLRKMAMEKWPQL